MDYFVPQIKHESKIGGMNMPQIITLGIGIVLILIFFLLMPDQVLVFLPIIGTITAIFTFVRIFDMPLPMFLYQILVFQFVRKIYLWRKQTAATPSKRPFQSVVKKEATGSIPGTVITARKSRLEQLKQDI